jgi:hypothetical protein
MLNVLGYVDNLSLFAVICGITKHLPVWDYTAWKMYTTFDDCYPALHLEVLHPVCAYK